MVTREGMDEEEVGKKLERRAPRYKSGKSFTLDIEGSSLYAKIKSRFIQ